MASQKQEGNVKKSNKKLGEGREQRDAAASPPSLLVRKPSGPPSSSNTGTSLSNSRGELPSRGFIFFPPIKSQPIFRSIIKPERTPTSARAPPKCDVVCHSGKRAECKVTAEGLSLTPAWCSHSIKPRRCAIMRACWENDTSAESLTYCGVLIFSFDYKHSDHLSNTPPDARHCAGKRHTSAANASVVRFLQTQQSAWTGPDEER